MSFAIGEIVRLPYDALDDPDDPTSYADPDGLTYTVTDPDGNESTAVWPGGDVERRPGAATGRFILDVAADVAGFWTAHAESTGDPTSAQDYAWEVRPAGGTYPWRPDLTTVATYIPERTVTLLAPGDEGLANTFTNDTTPTADQVSTLIDAAARHVATKTGTINALLYEQARDAAAMRAAGLVELSYPVRDGDLNVGDRWLKLADSAIDALSTANLDPTSSVHPSALVPVYSFPDAPVYGDLNL